MKKLMMNVGKVLSYGLSLSISIAVLGVFMQFDWFERIFDAVWIETEYVCGGLVGLIIWGLLVGVIVFGVDKLWDKIFKKVEE